MRINFEKVILHNFLSYAHSEINLSDKGYCLVSGVNHDKRDNSLSNGSGKSSWSSGICWALTGQTIQGKKNDLKNIYIDENSCYVTVEFSVDNNKFIITRYKEPKSDLKISVNGEDKSGKGIKESEAVLAEYLPDLTSELIASIIILGQGLPLKFTNNTPSGRKEVLEKLSKSDFMIQDIKNRLSKVINLNNSDLRKLDDSLLTLTTQEDMYNNQLTTLKQNLEELNKPRNFEVEIDTLSNNITELETLVNEHLNKVSEYEKVNKELNDKLGKILTEKQQVIDDYNKAFDSKKSIYYDKKTELLNSYTSNKNELTIKLNSYNSELTKEFTEIQTNYQTEIKTLKAEITRLSSITDTCPTCGQKIPGVVVVDIKPKQEEVNQLTKALNEEITKYNASIAECKTGYDSAVNTLTTKYNSDVSLLDSEFGLLSTEKTNYLKKIEDLYQGDITNTNFEIRKVKQSTDLLNGDVKLKNSQILDKRTQLNKIKLEFDNYNTKLQETQTAVTAIEKTLEDLRSKKLYNNNERSLISDKLAIDKKIETLIKRDFRGFLLSNVINFIDAKSKEYALDIFGNDGLRFYLDGNNIEISYLQKSFENLSGGEKQKVDLIIQFAIRDMMSKYLDFSCNIFILDEIFDNLDVLGCSNVLNLISRKLNDIESMFIISHHADTLEIPYDCEMVVIKDQNGISKVK